MLQARLSHVGLRGADSAGNRRFYEDVVGLRAVAVDGGRTRLALGGGAHLLELEEGEGLDHFALEVADEEQRAALLERLAQHGIAPEPIEDADHPDGLRFSDPEGHVIELHGRVERVETGVRADGHRPIGLHHITVTSPDVPALTAFYRDVLGFVVSDRMGDRFAWLRCNREHHTVAIVQGEAGGLDHYCYEVSDWEDIKDWCDLLAVADVPVSWGPGRHGPGNNVFIMFDDPDGVHIELSCEMERFWDDRVEYPPPRNWASELRTVNLWGPAPEWRRPLEEPAA
ncbi:MAG TPA: VOC family protein [Solirubrobacterales bacterium]|jgi:catechol 2,3-dioxygenase-like lactoylglutathione lyase family enzyme